MTVNPIYRLVCALTACAPPTQEQCDQRSPYLDYKNVQPQTCAQLQAMHDSAMEKRKRDGGYTNPHEVAAYRYYYNRPQTFHSTWEECAHEPTMYRDTGRLMNFFLSLWGYKDDSWESSCEKSAAIMHLLVLYRSFPDKVHAFFDDRILPFYGSALIAIICSTLLIIAAPYQLYVLLLRFFPTQPDTRFNSEQKNNLRLRLLTGSLPELLAISAGDYTVPDKVLFDILYPPPPKPSGFYSGWLVVRIETWFISCITAAVLRLLRCCESCFLWTPVTREGHLDRFILHGPRDAEIRLARAAIKEHKDRSVHRHASAYLHAMSTLYEYQSNAKTFFYEGALCDSGVYHSKLFYDSLVIQLQDFTTMPRGELNITVTRQLNGYVSQNSTKMSQAAILHLQGCATAFIHQHIPISTITQVADPFRL